LRLRLRFNGKYPLKDIGVVPEDIAGAASPELVVVFGIPIEGLNRYLMASLI
jgi:hypothetical protein